MIKEYVFIIGIVIMMILSGYTMYTLGKSRANMEHSQKDIEYLRLHLAQVEFEE